MDQFLGALAEPWARRWSGQVAGAALTFWVAGLVLYVARTPASALACSAAGRPASVWCRVDHLGTLGVVTVCAGAAAAVIGSAFVVAALAPRLVSILAGDSWPVRGPGAPAARSVLRWLLHRQVDRLGNMAATGAPVQDRVPQVAEGTDRRRRAHRAIAAYAADMRTDQAATAALRRYPAAPGAVGVTRVGCALAAMNERVWRRHGLDLWVCWEPLVGVLPDNARQSLARESTRVTLQAQNMVWAFAAIAWTSLLDTWWAALIWLVAALLLVSVLYGGLCSAVDTYCDLIEATVVLHRQRLYQTVGLALPASTGAEPAAGAALSGYLGGTQPADLPLSWAAEDDSGSAAGNGSGTAAARVAER
jgi:hypothetical protein